MNKKVPALIVVGMIALVAFWNSGLGPMKALWPAKTDTPAAYRVLGIEQAKTTSLDVMIPWTETGYCEGDVEQTAVEEAGTVRVSPAVRRSRPIELWKTCIGVGTDGKELWLPVKLSQPLGERALVGPDGQELPLRTYA